MSLITRAIIIIHCTFSPSQIYQVTKVCYVLLLEILLSQFPTFDMGIVPIATSFVRVHS